MKLGSNFDCAVAPLVPFVPLEAIVDGDWRKCLGYDLGYLGMSDDEEKGVWDRTWRLRR